jgi:hypothetical protein
LFVLCRFARYPFILARVFFVLSVRLRVFVSFLRERGERAREVVGEFAAAVVVA